MAKGAEAVVVCVGGAGVVEQTSRRDGMGSRAGAESGREWGGRMRGCTQHAVPALTCSLPGGGHGMLERGGVGSRRVCDHQARSSTPSLARTRAAGAESHSGCIRQIGLVGLAAVVVPGRGGPGEHKHVKSSGIAGADKGRTRGGQGLISLRSTGLGPGETRTSKSTARDEKNQLARPGCRLGSPDDNVACSQQLCACGPTWRQSAAGQAAPTRCVCVVLQQVLGGVPRPSGSVLPPPAR